MTSMMKILAIVTLATLAASPVIATAQTAFQSVDRARQDRRANEGFATSRDTTGTGQEGGYVRYSMGYGNGARSARSAEEADRQFSRGNDAYAAGEYGTACTAFRHAKNLYARSRDSQMQETSASLANDACSNARTNRSG